MNIKSVFCLGLGLLAAVPAPAMEVGAMQPIAQERRAVRSSSRTKWGVVIITGAILVAGAVWLVRSRPAPALGRFRRLDEQRYRLFNQEAAHAEIAWPRYVDARADGLQHDEEAPHIIHHSHAPEAKIYHCPLPDSPDRYVAAIWEKADDANEFRCDQGNLRVYTIDAHGNAVTSGCLLAHNCENYDEFERCRIRECGDGNIALETMDRDAYINEEDGYRPIEARVDMAHKKRLKRAANGAK